MNPNKWNVHHLIHRSSFKGNTVPELRLENSLVDYRYLVERCLGRGSYANISRVRSTERRHAGNNKVSKYTLQEHRPGLERTLVETFRTSNRIDRVRDPHIISDWARDRGRLEGAVSYIVLEYMPGGDLWSLCRTRPVLWDDAMFCFQADRRSACVRAQQASHPSRYKTHNILLSRSQCMKIADSALPSCARRDQRDHPVGTNVYARPNIILIFATRSDEKLTPSADIYSLAKNIYTD